MDRHTVLDLHIVTLLLSQVLVASSVAVVSNNKSIQTHGTAWRFPKLYGVNIESVNWESWTNEEVDRELSDIKNRGFNFVRFEVYFHRFIDLATPAFNPSRNRFFYDKLVYFLKSLDQKGLFAEPLLMEPWKFGDQMSMWWTNSTLQSTIRFFYRTFADWVRNTGVQNIVYITLWSEASYYFEWVDGYYIVNRSLASYPEANVDWRNWLSLHDISAADLTMDNINLYIDQYVSWSRTRFNEVTKLKANAVRDGWPGIPVSGEMGYSLERCGTVGPYHASKYLNLCGNASVDVLNDHDYFDSTWWSLEPYLNTSENRIMIVNEMGPPFYLGVYANDTERWWQYMEPKMNLATAKGKGFAIWSWMDYDGKPWGLKDAGFNPRPVLQLVTQWLAANKVIMP